MIARAQSAPGLNSTDPRGFDNEMTSTPHTATLRLALAATALVSALAVTGCVNGPRLVTPDPPPVPDGGPSVPSSNTAVLDADQQVVADTAEGHIKIEAGPGMRRVFNWDGLRRGAIIKARSKPFAGGDSKGIYFDGEPKVWKPAKGISKLRYEEGRRDFDNVDDAMIWMQIRRLYYTYNDDGLAIGWKREGNTLHVELWQFYIDGTKPSSLPDSESTHIARGPLKVEPQKMYPHLVFADGHTEPYNTDTASEYSNAQTGGTAETTASSQASDCNWFQRVFGQCDSDKGEDATTQTAVASTSNDDAATGNSGSAAASAANDATADSTNDKTAQTDADKPKAAISGKVVNIRSRPSTDSDVLMKAKKGDSVAILKEDRGWRYVQFDDGRKGWVADFLLKHQG